MISFKEFPEFGGPIQQAVFPLVVKIDNNLKSIGTGFAISADGLFMTAAHVLDEASNSAIQRQSDDGSYYNHYEFDAIYISNKPSSTSNTEETIGGLIPVDYICAPEELDIGFGWLRLPADNEGELLKIYPVRLRPNIPKVGTKIAALGYYKMSEKFKVENNTINYEQQTAISKGLINNVHPRSRDRIMMNFPCFQTDAQLNSGMSGGPIFDETGNVCGVVCSSFDTEGEELISYGSLIWPILGCKIDFLKNEDLPQPTLFYDLVKSGLIHTDETFQKIKVKRMKNGERQVSIELTNEN